MGPKVSYLVRSSGIAFLGAFAFIAAGCSEEEELQLTKTKFSSMAQCITGAHLALAYVPFSVSADEPGCYTIVSDKGLDYAECRTLFTEAEGTFSELSTYIDPEKSREASSQLIDDPKFIASLPDKALPNEPEGPLAGRFFKRNTHIEPQTVRIDPPIHQQETVHRKVVREIIGKSGESTTATFSQGGIKGFEGSSIVGD